MMLKLLVLIFAVSWEAHGCHPVLKHFDEEEFILCSSMFSTGITWLFNNQSEVGPDVVVSHEGRSIVIPASNKSVYGDYSCFQSNRFVNCSSLYISGECNITCAGLTTDIENTTGTSTFLIGSTITLYSTVMINLSPIDYSQGSFILYKDGIVLQRENVTYDRESFTYRLFNAQPTDTGMYYAEHISGNAMLITNRLFINVTNVTNHNPNITSKKLTSTSIIATTGTVNIDTTDMSLQAPTATANGNDDSSKTVGIAVGVSVAVLLVIGLVVVVIIAIVIYKRKKANDNNSSIPTEETHRDTPEINAEQETH